jgi:hypothetical protein
LGRWNGSNRWRRCSGLARNRDSVGIAAGTTKFFTGINGFTTISAKDHITSSLLGLYYVIS